MGAECLGKQNPRTRCHKARRPEDDAPAILWEDGAKLIPNMFYNIRVAAQIHVGVTGAFGGPDAWRERQLVSCVMHTRIARIVQAERDRRLGRAVEDHGRQTCGPSLGNGRLLQKFDHLRGVFRFDYGCELVE